MLRKPHCTRLAYLVRLALPAVALLLLLAGAARADVTRMKQHILVDDFGDAEVSLEVQLPNARVYTEQKQASPNFAVFLRQMGHNRDWLELEDVTGRFEDASNKIIIHYTARCVARTDDGEYWEVPLKEGADLQLVTAAGRKAIYTTAGENQWGVMTAMVTVEIPEGADDIQALSRPSRIRFRSQVVHSLGGEPDSDFSLYAKPQVMTCMAKCYSNPKFSYLWVARSKFKNTGTAMLKDFRLRYQIPGYTQWSSWSRTKRVVPGQTLIVPYFPIFDLNEINKLTGTRPAMLQVEYEYKTPEGDLVTDSDSRRIELLSRNEVLWSTIAREDRVSFEDSFDASYAIVGSAVNGNDPVMQQLAGNISRMGGGLATALKDDHARAFLETLYIFMEENDIAYQTSGDVMNGDLGGQHLKFGRDVLRNRSATCIDYTILFCSVCEAVGLDSAVVIIPGHAFAVAYLPQSGDVVAVECTRVGTGDYNSAVNFGHEELKQALKGPHQIIRISTLREIGVHSLDLPKEEITFLKDLGYEFPTISWSESSQQRLGKITHAAVGSWRFSNTINGVRVILTAKLGADGRYVFRYVETYGSQTQSDEVSYGYWAPSGEHLVFEEDDTQLRMTRKYYMKNGLLYIWLEEMQQYWGMKRVR